MSTSPTTTQNILANIKPTTNVFSGKVKTTGGTTIPKTGDSSNNNDDAVVDESPAIGATTTVSPPETYWNLVKNSNRQSNQMLSQLGNNSGAEFAGLASGLSGIAQGLGAMHAQKHQNAADAQAMSEIDQLVAETDPNAKPQINSNTINSQTIKADHNLNMYEQRDPIMEDYGDNSFELSATQDFNQVEEFEQEEII